MALKTKKLIIIASSLLATISHAQTRLRLQDALTIGLANRYDAQANRMNISLAENTVQQRRLDWMPELNLSGNVRYNTQLQTTVIPAGAFPGVTESQRLAFGTRNNTFFALDLTQPIYKPELKTDAKLALNSLAIKKEQHNQQQTSLKVQIAETYLNVLLKELQRDLAQADQQRYTAYLAIAEGRYKAGTLLESDYLQAKLDAQNADIDARKATQNYQLALDNLRYRLNLPGDTALELTDRLDPDALTDYQLTALSSYGQRSEIRQLYLRQEQYGLNSQKIRDELKPGLSFYANYSTQFQDNSLNYTRDAWSNFNYVGLKLNVPLSAQFRKRTSLLEYQFRLQQTTLTLRQTEADITYEIRKNQTDLTNATQNLRATKASLALSKQLYQIQQDKYRLGVTLYSTILDTERSLRTAEQNHIEAAYAYLVAKLNYEKAVGLY